MAPPTRRDNRRPSNHLGASLAMLLAALSAGCVPSEPTSPGETVESQTMLAAEAVEGLVAGAMAGWWRSSHGVYPGPALSTAADAHSSSWRNWGMLDAGAEPRQPLRTDASSTYTFTVAPWMELYRTLAAVGHALAALDGGVSLGSDSDERRLLAYGRFLQGLALGQLAQLYESAYILDETTDLDAAEMEPYTAVLEAAVAKLDEAEQLAVGGSFTVPAEWVGFHEPLTADDLARLVRSFRARLTMSTPRSPAERAAVDWGRILQDASSGITRDWGGYWDGDAELNWAWGIEKLWVGGHPGWARMDYRTIGPADARGRFQAWINSPPHDRVPFVIDTEDRRITDETGMGPGLYMGFESEVLFRPERGTDHFSYYHDTRWDHLFQAEGIGFYPDFPVDELALVRAEALYRLGDRSQAMAIVNDFRDRGGLPPFASPAQSAPGGDRCVPKLADGSCGDLWEALKYEKRIEIYHYGAFTEYLDDRGWGDLVPGTFTEFPPVMGDLSVLVEQILGGLLPTAPGAGTAERLRSLLDAYESFDRTRNQDPASVAGS